MLFLVSVISSCAPQYVVYNSDCIIFKKVEMDIMARRWLESTTPVPEFITFLDDVADNNDRLSENCSGP